MKQNGCTQYWKLSLLQILPCAYVMATYANNIGGGANINNY